MRIASVCVWLVSLALALAVTPAYGEIVFVTIHGVVESNEVTSGPLGNVDPGDPVVMMFSVDSDVFVNSATFPTRGYTIDQASFTFALGAIVMILQDPFPAGETPYFVLRDNDPAVDRFFVATSIDFPIGVPINETGFFEQFVDNFSVAFDGDTISSPDILGAIGTHDFTESASFRFTVEDGSLVVLGIFFEYLTISGERVFADGFESGDTTEWTSVVP